MMLLLGRDAQDALFLQLKEAGQSVLEPFLGGSEYENGAERVVQGQRLSQAASDIFIGWTRVEDEQGNPRDFYVRQLRDWKMSIDVQGIGARGLSTYAHWCAWSLARAHARSGDRVAIAAYLGNGDGFDRAVSSRGKPTPRRTSPTSGTSSPRTKPSNRSARHADLPAELLERGDVDLREGRERLDRVSQHVERHAGPDRQRGLLHPLAGLRAQGVRAGQQFAVAEQGQEAVDFGVVVGVGGGLRHVGQRGGGNEAGSVTPTAAACGSVYTTDGIAS